jgi:branched-subunit amino acid aminotransferase/4-amino-4-deoxychorismate lyase
MVTKNYCGIINLDTSPIRVVVEDLWPLRNYACFEVMEAKGMKVFHLEDHLDRLVHSMEILRLPPPPITGKLHLELKSFLRNAIREVVLYNRMPKSLTFLVRIYVTGGSTLDSFHPSSPPNLFIFAQPFSMPKFVKNANKGIKLLGINHLREFSDVKTTNYCKAEVVLPWAMGVKRCADILYFHNNCVLEGSTFNFFVVKNGIIRTAKENILSGVTRKVVIELAKKRGYEVKQREVPIFSVIYADEAFITTTTRGVWPVDEIIDCVKTTITLSEGPIALELRKAFLKYRRDYYSKIDKK